MTKELIKFEIDKVRDEYLEVLYGIVKALEEPGGFPASQQSLEGQESWHQFVAATYGSLAGAPIERGEQGEQEIRLPFE